MGAADTSTFRAERTPRKCDCCTLANLTPASRPRSRCRSQSPLAAVLPPTPPPRRPSDPSAPSVAFRGGGRTFGAKEILPHDTLASIQRILIASGELLFFVRVAAIEERLDACHLHVNVVDGVLERLPGASTLRHAGTELLELPHTLLQEAGDVADTTPNPFVVGIEEVLRGPEVLNDLLKLLPHLHQATQLFGVGID